MDQMDHLKILKRAFKITWDYKVLWIFGIILALTVASGGYGGGNGGSQAQHTTDQGDFQSYEGIPDSIELPDGSEIEVPEVLQEVNVWITIGVILVGCCCCLALVWIVAGTVLRYVAETALIRLVDDYEKTGEKRGIRAGFKMGWSRASFRLFLIDLLLFVAGVVVFVPLIIVMVALVAFAVLMFTQEVIVLGVIVGVAATGLFFLAVFFGVIVGVAIELFKPLFQRACVLESLGVGESLARSFDLMKRHFAWDVAIMWLLVIGLNIGWIVAMLIVGFLLFVVALAVAAAPALIIGGTVGLLFGWIAGLVVGGLVGGLIFVLLLIASMTFLKGLRMTFLSTLWTLTYRELLAIEGLADTEKEPLEAEYPEKEEEDSHELQ
jgi:hypothetical protein